MCEEVFLVCKELINDTKIGSSDAVFKDLRLYILTKARLVLTNEEFAELTVFAAERMK